MKTFPTKNQLLQTFLSYSNWEEKYIYIMDLGKLLPKFPESFRTTQYLVNGCQSYTWIALAKNIINTNNCQKQNRIRFYGDSDAAIIKGIIAIIFSLYQNLDINSIIDCNINAFLEKLDLTQHLTISRAQGIYFILNAIRVQIHKLMLDK